MSDRTILQNRMNDLAATFRDELREANRVIAEQATLYCGTDGASRTAALERLGKIAHRLAGTAGLFGFDLVGTVAMHLETEIDRPDPRPSAVFARTEQLIALIEEGLGDHDLAAALAPHDSGGGAANAPIRITYVEDEPDIREVGRIALENLGGFTVDLCADGHEALDSSRDFRPDLIILDVMMPGMNGVETYRRLRLMPGLADTPIIFMTARVQTEEVEIYRRLGCADVITKPFDPMALPQRVRSVWQQSLAA